MLIQANALHMPIASNSVQCCVTSPPYWGLRDYGITHQLGLEHTPEEYVANMVQVFREVRRVLKTDGTCWLNLGDSYYGSWQNYGGGNRGAGKQRPIIKGSSAKNPVWEGLENYRPAGTQPHGTLKPKDLVGIPWRVAFALQADGWYLRSDVIWSKPNPMPESVTDRPTKSHEYLFLLAKSEQYFYDAKSIKEPASPSTHARYARGRSNNHKWADGGPGDQTIAKSFEHMRTPGVEDRNKRTVWTIATQPWSGAHFATFPEKLVEPCILAGSKPGDLVLDPFVGSGTVVRVATRLQRKGVGVDLNMKYLHEQAMKRISKVQLEFQERKSHA